MRQKWTLGSNDLSIVILSVLSYYFYYCSSITESSTHVSSTSLKPCMSCSVESCCSYITQQCHFLLDITEIKVLEKLIRNWADTLIIWKASKVLNEKIVIHQMILIHNYTFHSSSFLQSSNIADFSSMEKKREKQVNNRRYQVVPKKNFLFLLKSF